MHGVEEFREQQSEATEWRRYLHQHPELDYRVHNTAKFVTEKLASFGIETAADVVRMLPKIVGVMNETKSNALLDWTRQLGSKFRFDRNAPPDPRLVAEVEQRLGDRQRELLATLRAGPGLLEQKRREIEYERARLEPAMDAALKELRSARAAASESES